MIKDNQTNIIRIKPIFSHQARWRCQSQSDIAYVAKSKPKMLSKIQLTNIMSSKIGNLGIRKLRNTLIDNKRASVLSFKKTPEYETLYRLLDINHHFKTLNICFDHDKDNIFKRERIGRLIRFNRYRNLSSLDMNFSCSKSKKDKILQSLSKQLRTLPKLQKLKINIRDCDTLNWRLELDRTVHHPYDPNTYLLKLQFPRALSSLDLTFGGMKFSKEDLVEFTSHVQKLISLENLSLNFTYSIQFQNIDSDEAQIWSSLFKKTQSLKTLNIKNSINIWNSLEGTQIFIESLQYPKNLKSLNLDLYFYREGNPDNVVPETVLSSLAAVPSFKSLKINLGYTLDPPKQIKNLLAQIQLLTQLEKFHLNLAGCTPINNAIFKKVVQIIQRLTKLNSLEILLSGKDIDPEKAILLVQNLKQLTSLKTLSLRFLNFYPNYEIIEILSKNISQLNLTSFQLILDPRDQPKPIFQRITSFWKSKKELTPFFVTLSGFKELTSLNLNLVTFEISIKESREFSEALKELKKLSSLTLELSHFNLENSSEGFQTLVSSLKENRRLRSLNLSFGRNSISKEEIKCLEPGLKECKSLESLKLDFQHTETLMPEDVRCLILVCESLFLLRNFQLGLVKTASTNEEVVKLVERMTRMKSLKHVKLNVSFPINVTLDPNYEKRLENERRKRA